MNNEYEKLRDRFPFLTYGRYLDQDQIGIVQNSDSQLLSMYVFNKIKDENEKKLFLELGETWWWESNRKIPINMFLGDEFKIFSSYLTTFILKEFQYILGPKVCIDNMSQKRVKRRTVQLIRKF